jgi:hypothetical protein
MISWGKEPKRHLLQELHGLPYKVTVRICGAHMLISFRAQDHKN